MNAASNGKALDTAPILAREGAQPMTASHTSQPTDARERGRTQPIDFSLVTGGALYQLWRRTGLCDDELHHVRRRIVLVIVITWLPLLLLSVAEGHAWSGVPLPFLYDIDTHIRMLIAAPLLLWAELRVYRELPRLVRRFVLDGVITDAVRPQYEAAIASALRLRNSVTAEVLLIAFVYGVGVPFVWRDQVALDVNSWYATAMDGRLHPWLAGWWAGLVAIPVFQFLCVRWYWRLIIWARFLWQVSRMDLKLEPAHPDGAAGLHFLAYVDRTFRPLLLAFGTVLAGLMANKIFYAGGRLLDFRVELAGTVVLLVFAILGPLLAFAPALRVARRNGMDEYGTLGQRYASEFDSKWIRGSGAAGEPLLGSADIQSLADLRNSFLVIQGIPSVPFGMKNVITLALVTLLPVAPLLLTTFSVEELFDRVLKVLL